MSSQSTITSPPKRQSFDREGRSDAQERRDVRVNRRPDNEAEVTDAVQVTSPEETAQPSPEEKFYQLQNKPSLKKQYEHYDSSFLNIADIIEEDTGLDAQHMYLLGGGMTSQAYSMGKNLVVKVTNNDLEEEEGESFLQHSTVLQPICTKEIGGWHDETCNISMLIYRWYHKRKC